MSLLLRAHSLWLSVLMGVPLAMTDFAIAGVSLNEFPTEESRPLMGPRPTDWLLGINNARSRVYRSPDGNELTLENGLIRRIFRVEPNGATVALDNLMTSASQLRAVKPEALLSLDGQEFAVGGLLGQKDHAYLSSAWINQLTNSPAAFQLASISANSLSMPINWKRVRHAGETNWPPKGIEIALEFKSPDSAKQKAAVTVHYQLFDGVPAMSKWITVRNTGDKPFVITGFTSELIAAVEAESAVDTRVPGEWKLPQMKMFSDYSFGGMDPTTANRVIQWKEDPEYLTQVNYNRKTPTLLAANPPVGPNITLEPGASFESFRVYLVLFDSDERERQGLTIRKLHRALTPWATENPLMMHVSNSDSKRFREAVDQCAEVGFEMIIYTFGSGLNMESDDPAYIQSIKEDVAYAHAKGIQVGGYSLLASRSVGAHVDVINPKSGKPNDGAIFGSSPCLATDWGKEYFLKVRRFLKETNFDLLEHDGSYPGDVCASKNHSGHKGYEDSQWQQWRMISQFYRDCRAEGIYLNVPDFYFFAGSTKVAIGYREDNWSLPRAQQMIHARQHIFDGTWEKTPSMGWSFVPLVQYHGGGAAATIEPLSQHLDDYERHLVINLGSGVQACYRGPRLYDSNETRALVSKWVAWFKEHRAILESDIIHLRRADGRDIDGILHANPALKERGLALFFNPLNEDVKREVQIPLYYTGLNEIAVVKIDGGAPGKYQLDRARNITVPLEIKANGFIWLLIEEEP
ncbi:MAG: alpha-galactosidase [Verrucomicrobiales bacterium]